MEKITDEELVLGLSDERLLELCSQELLDSERREYGATRADYWPQEIYSNGRCIREISGWPKWLPISVSMDHSVDVTSTLGEEESAFPSRTHFTWSEWRVAEKSLTGGKSVTQIMHPWVAYRRLSGHVPSKQAQGSLIFVPHSVPGHEPPQVSVASALDELAEGPAELAPRALMIAMHDIHRGMHRKLRSLGLPLLTAGHSSSPYFVDRFYAIASNFRAGFSQSPGSQAFFLEEMGIPFRVIGDPALYPQSIANVVGEEGTQRARFFSEIFSANEDYNEKDRENLVSSALGLASEPQQNLIWATLLFNLPIYFFSTTLDKVGRKLSTIFTGRPR